MDSLLALVLNWIRNLAPYLARRRPFRQLRRNEVAVRPGRRPTTSGPTPQGDLLRQSARLLCGCQQCELTPAQYADGPGGPIRPAELGRTTSAETLAHRVASAKLVRVEQPTGRTPGLCKLLVIHRCLELRKRRRPLHSPSPHAAVWAARPAAFHQPLENRFRSAAFRYHKAPLVTTVAQNVIDSPHASTVFFAAGNRVDCLNTRVKTPNQAIRCEKEKNIFFDDFSPLVGGFRDAYKIWCWHPGWLHPV
jgi:hypothetical protein